MKIKNFQLNLMLTILGQTTPNFIQARLRDKVIKSLSEDFKTFDENRIKICKELADKDKKGEPIMKDDNFQITKNMDKFQKELEILQKEEVNLILEGDEKQRLIKLIESTNYSPKFGETEIIDQILKDKPKDLPEETK